MLPSGCHTSEKLQAPEHPLVTASKPPCRAHVTLLTASLNTPSGPMPPSLPALPVAFPPTHAQTVAASSRRWIRIQFSWLVTHLFLLGDWALWGHGLGFFVPASLVPSPVLAENRSPVQLAEVLLWVTGQGPLKQPAGQLLLGLGSIFYFKPQGRAILSLSVVLPLSIDTQMVHNDRVSIGRY